MDADEEEEEELDMAALLCFLFLRVELRCSTSITLEQEARRWSRCKSSRELGDGTDRRYRKERPGVD